MLTLPELKSGQPVPEVAMAKTISTPSLDHGSVEKERRTTRTNQSLAADPHVSVWVSANAGAGKTYVLTQRVLRLLLAGTSPERLLCLTYTKSAASEMSKRVFDKLAEWAIATPERLCELLSELLSRAPNDNETRHARTLFAQAIETPGGLKVQTIHAFAERLLQRFPLEAGIAPHFSILDDEAQRALLRSSIDAVLTKATAKSEETPSLTEALRIVIAHAADDRFDNVLKELLTARDDLFSALQSAATEDPFDEMEDHLRTHFGVRSDQQPNDIERGLAAVLDDDTLAHIVAILENGGKTDQARAKYFAAAKSTKSIAARVEAFDCTFITRSTRTPVAKLMAKALAEAHPDVLHALERAQANFCKLRMDRLGLDIITASIALIRLADAVLQQYITAKAKRAALDYDDLIEKTASLLSRTDDAQWVLYKLDQGLDHILVDEAQDTSPLQWRMVQHLAEEFFSGSGARDINRTVFAVGDEKQSIYSFQGARPEMFARIGAQFAERAQSAKQTFHQVPLSLSFRTVEPILRAVDEVFSNSTQTPGVSSPEVTIRHVANRLGEGGLVELWPTETWHDEETEEPWQPIGLGTRKTPYQRLAENISDTIRSWLDNNDQLVSQGRAIRASDILVLVRKRTPFAAPMIRALKTRGIAVAGADRIQLTEQLAVMDLMALGDFLLLPEDDLALAAVLKSPLIGLDDDDLFAVAHDRKGSLWQALLRQRENSKFQDLVKRLLRWRAQADYAPPFEFYSLLLQKDALRQKFLSRLGPEAGDALDEFLGLAMRYDAEAPPSLQGFLAWLRSAKPQIRRDMDQADKQVRVMTVHGAKGLEAPIVFLADTCSLPTAGPRPSIVSLGSEDDQSNTILPPVWAIKGASKHPRIKAAGGVVKLEDSAEYNRLLYVAMTRARDRIYITGYEGRAKRSPHCWYDLVLNALSDQLETLRLSDGRNVLRLETKQAFKPCKVDLTDRMSKPCVPLPDWVGNRARTEPQRTIPRQPARLIPLDADDTSELVHDQPILSPTVLSDDSRFARGLITHALLQHLPSLQPDRWRNSAHEFVAHKGQSLTKTTQCSIVNETLAILENSRFDFLFGAQSLAEVPLIAEIHPPSGRGAPIQINGQADRLAILDNEVVIVDYKTNRPPPTNPEAVPKAYLLQLAAYRMVLARIYPDKTSRAVLLWTYGPHIMEISSKALNNIEQDLWTMPPDLDA